MLEAVPKGWLSNNYIIQQDGLPTVELHKNMWSEQGGWLLDDLQYTITRDGMTGPFILLVNGAEIARAHKQSVWTKTFDLYYEDKQYLLKAKSVWTREFIVLFNDQIIGSVFHNSVWTRKFIIDIPGLPLPLQLFVGWLALVMWQRDEAAAVAAAT